MYSGKLYNVTKFVIILEEEGNIRCNLIKIGGALSLKKLVLF